MTGIQWTEVTWNPVTGCDRVSPGCDHCYAMTLAKRLKAMGSAKYQADGDPRTSGPGFGITMHEDVLTEPLRWRKPRRVFVNSMADVFHKGVTDEFTAKVWAVMSMTPQHTYQVLTKRHARMRSLLADPRFPQEVDRLRRQIAARGVTTGTPTFAWPLPNVHLGVSVENQTWADTRIPALVDTPAVVRFLSCEPLLGPVDLAKWMPPGFASPLGWVIAGGESGPDFRPMAPAWARGIRDACQSAGVPFFFKQWGGRTPKTLGRELDGRLWDEMPVTVQRPAMGVES